MRQSADVSMSMARTVWSFIMAAFAGLGLVSFIILMGLAAADCRRNVPPPFVPEPVRAVPPAAPTFYEGTPLPALPLGRC